MVIARQRTNRQACRGGFQTRPYNTADETAVVVIPEPKKTLVLSKANEIRAAEDSQRADIAKA
jgi:regulator of RNase E activity RraA